MQPAYDEKSMSLVERLLVFMGDLFESDINTFFKEHCHKFERDDVDEGKLEFTELHKRYEKIFERHIEDFIEKEGISAEDFYDELKKASKEDEINKALIEIVLASTDYEWFDMLMRARASMEDRDAPSSGK